MLIILLFSFSLLFAEGNIIILEPKNQSIEQINQGKYYTNEGFRAASFGSNHIARDLFYKACSLGDDLGCRAFNEINAPLRVEKILIQKQECDFGDKDACFSLFRYYSSQSILDSFKSDWYLSKACRLGKIEACNLEVSKFKPYIQSKAHLLGNQCFYNNKNACYELGNMYLFGIEVVKNVEFAKELIKKSCDIGLKKACNDYIRILSLN
ncbi:sel1 repeat family protein [Helicobacter sp. MIT 14-3879]|uniref:sel1 repeat family protein n=1 Tax=Helicobacter sp. MIT 14-3879 TaxID=2040649 RepID=UPI000E1F4F24|nr:sel1 repeat family protein [Helicobacter sp. MIT 14-3879]RDU63179.1 hypothetical protein CQA44_05950 [Helicobacter sp. MIT 14-3879]